MALDRRAAATPIPTLREILDTFADALGVSYELREMPAWPVRSATRFVDVLMRPFPGEIGRVQALKFLTRSHAYDTSRARSELGWESKVPLREGVVETVEWFRREGLLPA